MDGGEAFAEFLGGVPTGGADAHVRFEDVFGVLLSVFGQEEEEVFVEVLAERFRGGRWIW